MLFAKGWPRFVYKGTVVVVLMCLLSFLISCEKKEPVQVEAPPQTVSAVTVIPRDIPVQYQFVAKTQSSQHVDIHARVSGFLDKRLYNEGEMVKAGQPLFQLDVKPFQAKVDEAQAAVEHEEAALEVARQKLARTKNLAAQKVLSQSDLDNDTGQYEAAMASVRQAKAHLETAKLDLSYTTICAPVNGISGSAVQPEGSYVSLQNSLLTSVDVLTPMWVNFSLSENEILKYRSQRQKGLLIPPDGGKYEVEVVLADGSVFPNKGEITFAAPSYDSQTGTFMIRTSLENSEGALRPNQFVHARLSGAVRPNAIMVPQRAVQESSKGQFVWVAGSDGKAEKRPVEVGSWHGGDWFIEEGLKAGEKVIVDGALTLQAGTPVSVTVLTNDAEISSTSQSGE